MSLLERVMAKLRAEYAASGKEDLFVSLEVFLLFILLVDMGTMCHSATTISQLR